MRRAIEDLIKRLKEQAGICRQVGREEEAGLFDQAAGLLELIDEGRNQDQKERSRCIEALDAIALDQHWMTRDAMVLYARRALKDIGAWTQEDTWPAMGQPIDRPWPVPFLP